MKLLGDAAVPVAISDTRRLVGGFRPLDQFDLTHVTPTGGVSPTMTREVLRCRRVVSVLPYDPVTDELVLMRQFRLAAHLAHGRGEMVEVPAGGVDAGEDLAAAARRELHEETGLDALDLVAGPALMPSPGSIDEFNHLFLARVDAGAARGVAGLHEEGEVITTHAVQVADALAAARAGAMTNGYTLMMLFWFEPIWPDWRQRWGGRP